MLSFLCCGSKQRAPVAPVIETRRNLATLRRSRRSSTVGMTTGTTVPTEVGGKRRNQPLHEYRFPRAAEGEEANVSA